MVKNSLIALISLFLLVSCSAKVLKFTGNLPQPVYLEKNSSLAAFLYEENIQAESALITGKDGTAAYVGSSSFKHIELVRVANQWNSIASELPEVVNINDISHISLFTREKVNSLNLLNQTDQIDLITPFEAEYAEYQFLGKSAKNDHYASKYKFSHAFQQSSRYDSVLAIFKSGKEKWLYPDEEDHLVDVKFRDTCFSYAADTLVTIWEDPPLMNVYDLYEQLQAGLDEKKCLIIFLDSYGWIYKEHLVAIGYSGKLTEADLVPLCVPYPPRTLNSFWVLGAGKAWQDRNEQDDYFADLYIAPDKALIIEADRQFYPSPVKHILNTDGNGDGTIDDEIYQEALKHFEDEIDLLLVHFHSLDDRGHETGAYSEARYTALQKLEEYIAVLADQWSGSVYLFSDHGMHTEGDKGVHYTGSAEDMLGVWGKLK